MKKLFRIIKHLVFGNKYTNASNLKYARSIGVKIGKNCKTAIRAWGSEPFLIELGNHVHITSGVTFANHDGGVWVFREEIPNFDVFGKIKIGDNTYIGPESKILPGVTIGKNCVIGAGTIVTKCIPDNSVAAGNPVRIIRTTEEYKEKMIDLNLQTKTMGKKEKKSTLLNITEKKLIKRNSLINN